MDLSKYYNEKLQESISSNRKPITTTFYLSTMHMSVCKNDIKRIQTYKLKMSDKSNLYITINKETFSCFGNDKNNINNEDEYTIFINESFLVYNGKLNQSFWKEILSNLPTQYKR